MQNLWDTMKKNLQIMNVVQELHAKGIKISFKKQFKESPNLGIEMPIQMQGAYRKPHRQGQKRNSLHRP